MTAGKYSEHAFQALDYILDEAAKYGVRLLLTLVNNWDNADSKTQVRHPVRCNGQAAYHIFGPKCSVAIPCTKSCIH